MMVTPEKFEQLFDEHFNDVAAFLHAYSSDRGQLKDWVQEVFIKLWESREQIDFDHPAFKSYLFTTARNHALKKIQKEKRYGEWLEQNLIHLTERRIQKDPAIHSSEIEKEHCEALSKIPSRSRRAYLLSREDGLTYKEIAKVMGISVKTVEVHIHKALQILRSALKDYG